MKSRPRRLDPKNILHNLCNMLEIRSADIPDRNLTRVMLPTQTSDANIAFRFDEDLSGFQYSALLEKLNREDRRIYAELASENPPREITPVVLSNGFVGIQGAKSFLPRNKNEIEHVYTEIFGRVSKYIDEDFQDIMTRLKEIKDNNTDY